ncbi:hypothetical protein SHIRM173S_06247 [Streptomyces hirsutus]
MANLQAQIDSLVAGLHGPRSGQTTAAPAEVAGQALLVDLLILRGQVLGRIADYERAAELAEQLVRAAPDDDASWLVLGRGRKATFHRFAEALADLDAARRRGSEQATVDVEQAADPPGGRVLRRGPRAAPDRSKTPCLTSRR